MDNVLDKYLELFSKVLGFKVLSASFEVDCNDLLKPSYVMLVLEDNIDQYGKVVPINSHDLAYRCKSWLKEEKDITFGSGFSLSKENWVANGDYAIEVDTREELVIFEYCNNYGVLK